jgi:hypothetical protein
VGAGSAAPRPPERWLQKPAPDFERRLAMLARSLAILLAPCLPVAALIFPLGTLHRVSALVSGTIAVALSALALSNEKARVGGAIVGAWVALTALVFPSTLLEEVIALSWGVLMFSWLAGPFSSRPEVIRLGAPAPAKSDDRQLPLAA